jgi:hypothetical protein
LREVGRRRLPDLQWRPAGTEGLWQHGEFRPYPWKQNWVSFHSCHQRLLMQPDSEKIKTNPLITVDNLDLTRKNGWNRILAVTEAKLPVFSSSNCSNHLVESTIWREKKNLDYSIWRKRKCIKNYSFLTKKSEIIHLSK